LMAGVLALGLPGGYGDRLFTILHTENDETGSAQERSAILKRATLISLRHPIIGVGMANFHIYSIRERKAHNAYLEIAAELGLGGLLAYLLLLYAPLRSLQRIEQATVAARDQPGSESYYLSTGLQATLVAYLVCSFFASIQYQWFVYYPIAWAIALRRINQAEGRTASGVATSTRTTDGNFNRGSLWQLKTLPGES
jgi:O-antigen ligase